MDPKGKIALITGGSNGIGEATARRLAQAGTTVVLADLDEARGQAIIAELGAPHRFMKLDVADDAAWETVLAAVKTELGGLHILFLNAGVQLRPLGAPAGDAAMKWLNIASYKRVARINGDGVMYGLILGFPLIRDSGGGVIIATGSTAAVEFYKGDPAYSFTKAGVLAAVSSVADEFAAEGVRVCAICPGSVDTRMYPSDRRTERAGAAQSIPASPFYLANSVLTIVAQGNTGEIWFARPDDKGFFTYRMPRLPPSPVDEDPTAGRRFVSASIDGTMLAGQPIGGG